MSEATVPAPARLRRFHQAGADAYRAEDGHVMRREYGLSPNGNHLRGRWVLRSPEGEFLGFDQYRSDLAAHFGFSL